MRIGINGLGRIGRGLFRTLASDGRVQVAAVNDVADASITAHLLRHDSYYGAWEGVSLDGDGRLRVEGRAIPFTHETSPDRIPWGDSGVQWVVEATGKFKTRRALEAHGLPVLLTAASPEADRQGVFGVNHGSIAPSDRILSAASCTTHCVAPPLAVLAERFDVLSALFNTVHCYNVGQTLVDAPQKDARRARAGALNLIPTTTSASLAIEAVLPALAGRVQGMAVRVPAPAVSLTELTVHTARPASAREANDALREAAEGRLMGVLAVSEEPLVSQDFLGNTASSIVDLPLTQAADGMLRIIAWYDNEWGYINRLVDLLAFLKEMGP